MGSALMKTPETAKNIMKVLVQNFKGKISVSCKIRILNNFDDTLRYVLDMQEIGIDFISIHPRTQTEESKVPAKWYIIK